MHVRPGGRSLPTWVPQSGVQVAQALAHYDSDDEGQSKLDEEAAKVADTIRQDMPASRTISRGSMCFISSFLILHH